MIKRILLTIAGALFCIYVGYAVSVTLADAYIQANTPLAAAETHHMPEAAEAVTHTTAPSEAPNTTPPAPPSLPTCTGADEPGIRHIAVEEDADGRVLSLHLPETDSLEVNEAIRAAVFSRADAFAGAGFFASRYASHMYNDQLVSFAFTFTECGADGTLAETAALMAFDLLGGLAVPPSAVFAPDYDYATATAAALGGDITVDFTAFAFDAAQAVFLYAAADGGTAAGTVPLSVYGDSWQADAYLLRYYAGVETTPPDDAEPPEGTGKYLAITFDDGPESTQTARLLDGLAEHGARATFFVLGHRLGKTADLIERMVNEGHSVGSHTYSHVNLAAVTRDTIAYQLDETNRLLKEITGLDVTLLRPPYGNRSALVAEMAAERGMALIIWSVDPQDWKVRDARQTADHIVSRAQDGEIILLHDIYATSVDAALLAVAELTAQGYTFVTVEELLALNGGYVAGGVYRTGKGAAAK